MMAISMMNLDYNYFGASLTGETRHAREVLKSMGVKWQGTEGRPITDSIVFTGCSDIPEALPDYIKIVDRD